jgi:hypothetical protein
VFADPKHPYTHALMTAAFQPLNSPAPTQQEKMAG